MLTWSAGALGLATAAYAACVGRAWVRYGYPSRSSAEDADALLDRFMPVYDVAERHHVRVADLIHSAIVRAIFKSREQILGSEANETARPRGLLALTTSMG
jgi:hypothetical protein